MTDVVGVFLRIDITVVLVGDAIQENQGLFL